MNAALPPDCGVYDAKLPDDLRLSVALRTRAAIRLKATCRGEEDRLSKQLIEAADRLDDQALTISTLCKQVKELQAKVDWMEGKHAPFLGFPWERPYLDGYESAVEDLRGAAEAAGDELAATRKSEMEWRAKAEAAYLELTAMKAAK